MSGQLHSSQPASRPGERERERNRKEAYNYTASPGLEVPSVGTQTYYCR